MHNVQNFRYIADTFFDEKWDTREQWEIREYNLDNIQGLGLFLSYRFSEHIAHTILSWDFGQDNHLAISIEARRDKNQRYSIVKGFFKQYELSFIAADERDIIRLCTNYRKEPIYAYHLNVTKEQARSLLEKYVAEMNSLVNKPEFYNTLNHNSATLLKLQANVIEPGNQFPTDWRIIATSWRRLLFNNSTLRSTATVNKKDRAFINIVSPSLPHRIIASNSPSGNRTFVF